jgi:nicotinamidase-related amidase
VSTGRSALVVVDMLNTYDHEDADSLTASVEQAVGPMSELIDRAVEEGVGVIYVNDNYGDWHASPEEIADRAMHGERPDLVEPILPPGEEVPFIIKARHTIFYGTPLEYFLGQNGIRHLVLAGQVTEQCILYSALDAYVRELSVSVPRDAVAHIHEGWAGAALEMMEGNMDAEICTSSDCEMRPGGSDGGG